MIKAAIFDLDGTLHDRQTSVETLVKSQYARFTELQRASEFEYLTKFMALDNRGYTPKPEVYATLSADLDLPQGLAKELENDFFERYANFSVAFPEAIETLDLLRERDLKLGLITNGAEKLQRTKLRSLGMEDHFDAILISETEGLKKPEPEIYLRCLRSLEVEPAQAVMIGDHPDLDVKGPQAVGMRAIWFCDPYWGSCEFADAVASHLDEIPQVVETFSFSATMDKPPRC
jgi:putative hydrolase of the HAD superfamily